MTWTKQRLDDLVAEHKELDKLRERYAARKYGNPNYQRWNHYRKLVEKLDVRLFALEDNISKYEDRLHIYSKEGDAR